MKKYIISSFAAFVLALSVAHAQVPPNSALIQQLLKQLNELSAAVEKLKANQVSCTRFEKDIPVFSRGAEVTRLQNFLIQKGLARGVVNATGYYGPNTQNSIEEFKKQKGIVEAGFGLKTRAALNTINCGTNTTPTETVSEVNIDTTEQTVFDQPTQTSSPVPASAPEADSSSVGPTLY